MKRILSLIICMAIVISSVGVVALADTNHWSYDYIKGMISDGVVSGDQNGNLNLDNLITRAEFAKTVNKYFGYTVKADQGFNDVSADKWYYNDMLIAKGTGYMIGDASGNANADSYITRAETFVIIARLLGLDDDNTVSFADEADIPSWAKGKIGALVKKGIISGYTDGSIKANGNITRAEAFTVVSKNERTTLPSDSAQTENLGNTSSMVHTGGSSGGGGGGGGSYAPPSSDSSSTNASSTVDLRNFNASTYDLELYVENASTVIFNYSVEGVPYPSSPVSVTSGTNLINIKSQIETICMTREKNGETFTLTSITANANSGYDDKTATVNKTFVGDILSDLKVTGLTDNDYDATTGELKVSWTAVDGVTDYRILVYKSNEYTQANIAAYYDVLGATNGTVPVSTDFTNFTFGNTYYIGVAVKKGVLVGTVNSDNCINKTSGFAGGNGESGTPYIITDIVHLKNIDSESHYKQIKDITEALTTPLCSSTAFKGVYDGGNYSVNLNINVTGQSAGMFAKATGATIKNVVTTGSVKSTYTTTSDGTGGIVGYANGGTIQNCTNGATVESTYYVGGIVGLTYTNAITIKGCSNTATITATGYDTTYYSSTGGILGKSYKAGSLIEDCHNSGAVSIPTEKIVSANKWPLAAGGVVGYLLDSKVVGCSNKGSVEGAQRIGGIVGLDIIKDSSLDVSKIGVHNSYNAGKIKAYTEYPGGITSFIWLYNDGVKTNYLNNFNAGECVLGSSESTASSGGLIGYLYENKSDADFVTTFISTGFYDAKGYPVIYSVKNTPVQTYVELYSLNGTTSAHTTSIIKNDLIALTSKSGSVFSDSTKWISLTNYWKYPQIVGNIYTPVVKPVDLDVSYLGGKYTLTWECALEGAVTYTVYVNNSPLTPTSIKSQEISLAGLKDAAIKVVANDGTNDYTSDEISATDCVPTNLNVSYADSVYTLTWDCLADNAEYEVFVDGDSQDTVSATSKVIDIKGLINKDVKVVATVDGKTYESEVKQVTDYAPYGLEVKPDNGKFMLEWKCELDGATYNVYVGEGDTEPDVTTLKSQEVNISGQVDVPIYVTATKDGVTTYISETIRATGEQKPVNLEIGYNNGKYVLTWDCAMTGDVSYTVNIDGADQTPTTETTFSFVPELKEQIPVTVVADDGAQQLTSDTITVNGIWAENNGVCGDGTENNPYLIATAEQFVNTFDNTKATDESMAAHYYLISDIDLSGKDYVPSSKLFTGSLTGYDFELKDKNGIVVGGLAKRTINIGGTEDAPVVRTPVAGIKVSNYNATGGVFNEIYRAKLSHLVTEGYLTIAAKDSKCYMGGFVGMDEDTGSPRVGSTLEYLDNNIKISANGSYYVGGIVGFSRSGIMYCQNFAEISGGTNCAGIVGGGNTSTFVIEKCYNSGAITGTSHTGGITGNGYQKVVDCGNSGAIKSTGNSVGGIMGQNSTSANTVSGCFNTGSVTGTGSIPTGGIVGRLYIDVAKSKPTRGVNISDCYNSGIVSGSTVIGSVIGNVMASVKDNDAGGTPATINGFYDLANSTLPLFSATYEGTVENPVAYILNGTGDAASYTADETTIKGLVDNTVWKTCTKTDNCSDENCTHQGEYQFPTLVKNPYDDNLGAFTPSN